MSTADLRARASELLDRAADASDPRQADRLREEAAEMVERATEQATREALDALEALAPLLPVRAVPALRERMSRVLARLGAIQASTTRPSKGGWL